MREAFAFILFLVVVALGWKQPYSKHYYGLIGKPAPKARQAFAATPSPAERLAQIEAKYGAPAATRAATEPPKDRSWMFEKTKMDSDYKANGR